MVLCQEKGLLSLDTSKQASEIVQECEKLLELGVIQRWIVP